MVVVQFVISVSLIAGTFLIYRQLDYINNKDLGIDNKDLAVIALRDRSMMRNYKTLKAEIQNLPGVLNVTGSSAYLGNYQQRRGFFPEGSQDRRQAGMPAFCQPASRVLPQRRGSVARDPLGRSEKNRQRPFIGSLS